MTLPLNNCQVDLLRQAAELIDKDDWEKYVRLKTLFRERPEGFELKFRKLFSGNYGLNSSGLTDEWKDRYFETLFHFDAATSADPYSDILLDLYRFRNRRGKLTLQCSFVSKLVAVHDETRPIYDRFVRNFFGLGAPDLGGVHFRIAGYVANLELLRNTYFAWERNSDFQQIIQHFKERHPSATDCAVPRLADFLVWTAGKKKLIADAK